MFTSTETALYPSQRRVPEAQRRSPDEIVTMTHSREYRLHRAFKEIATLQRIEVVPPPDRATDFAGGSRLAGELGMKRLAERLGKLATA